jgi:hypothetical protein
MNFTISELHGLLQDLIDAGHEDKVVMLAQQPNYPLEFTLGGATITDDALYLLEGTSQGYASRDLWEDSLL